MWDLVPWPGIKPGPPALGAQRPSHGTTREVPGSLLKFLEQGGLQITRGSMVLFFPTMAAVN